MCDEFEEVGFFILNDYGAKRNVEYIQEFVDFIKANEIRFHKKPADRDKG
jgi:hypothetical protein